MISVTQVQEVLSGLDPLKVNPRDENGYCQYAFTDKIRIGDDGVSERVPSCVIGNVLFALDKDVFADVAGVRGSLSTIVDWDKRTYGATGADLGVANKAVRKAFTGDALRLMVEVQHEADRKGTNWGQAILRGRIACTP